MQQVQITHSAKDTISKLITVRILIGTDKDYSEEVFKILDMTPYSQGLGIHTENPEYGMGIERYLYGVRDYKRSQLNEQLERSKQEHDWENISITTELTGSIEKRLTIWETQFLDLYKTPIHERSHL